MTWPAVGSGGGTGTGAVNDDYTAAQLASMASAGTLTPNTLYAASDTGALYWASDASTLSALSSVYGDASIERLAGVPSSMTALLAWAGSAARARPCILYQGCPLVEMTQAAGTWGTLTASDVGGKLRLAGTGAHGIALGSVASDGLPRASITRLPVLRDAVAQWLTIFAVIDSTTLEFVESYTAGAYTYTASGSTSPLVLHSCGTLPGGVLGPNGRLRIDATIEGSGTTNARYLELRLDSTVVSTVSYSGTAGGTHLSNVTGHVTNAGSQSAQRNAQMNYANQLASGLGLAVWSTAVDTAVDRGVNLQGRVSGAGDIVRLAGLTITVLPGA